MKRLKSIRLEWFRGAAEPVELQAGGKSLVVYGPNGSGKSSFVDAVEYFLGNGKIGHLSHEYSGKKQEKGVINTHKPGLSPTTATLGFDDGTAATVVVKSNGTFALSGDGQGHLDGVDYRQVVLRQDEVAAFISSAKGEKYSALLPLLGLERLEAAAENTRQLARRLARAGELEEKERELERLKSVVGGRVGSIQDLEARVAAIHASHRAGEGREQTLRDDCVVLQPRLRQRLEGLTPDVRRHEALQRLGEIDFESAVAGARAASGALVAAAIEHLRERVGVLENVEKWVGNQTAESVACPACGRLIARQVLTEHLASERRTFDKGSRLLDEARRAADELKRVLMLIKEGLSNPLVARWWAGRGRAAEDDLKWSREFDLTSVDADVTDALLRECAERLEPILVAARTESRNAPPETRGLLEEFGTVQAGEAFLTIEGVREARDTVQAAVDHLNGVETALRALIRETADATIAEISLDIQRMWAILHPGHEIENVRLKHPDETDKAIDIELKFFGVELRSPRLTLSEGNRNSLGLCVFLAMAKRASGEHPVILDDVVVSLDREHRGMVVEVLEREFEDRQVVLLTHDRDWASELRHFLQKGWQHLALVPYRGPESGIAFAARGGGLEEARAMIEKSPDSAGNTARKIMDTELSFIVDRLKIKMEYRQGLKNDHRMAHEFLEAIKGAFKRALQVKQADGTYKEVDVSSQLDEADKLIVAWGNRASHSFDVTKSEATKLIDNCEAALGLFVCDGCKKPIYKLDDGNGTKQCECGSMRWRYGKL